MQTHQVVHADNAEFTFQEQALGRRDDRLPRCAAPSEWPGLNPREFSSKRGFALNDAYNYIILYSTI
jgi:hypothetical protein